MGTQNDYLWVCTCNGSINNSTKILLECQITLPLIRNTLPIMFPWKFHFACAYTFDCVKLKKKRFLKVFHFRISHKKILRLQRYTWNWRKWKLPYGKRCTNHGNIWCIYNYFFTYQTLCKDIHHFEKFLWFKNFETPTRKKLIWGWNTIIDGEKSTSKEVVIWRGIIFT